MYPHVVAGVVLASNGVDYSYIASHLNIFVNSFENGAYLEYNGSMTTITHDDVLHLARLSSLQLADDEIDALKDDLTNIIGYIEQLSTLDTEGVEPTYQVTGLSNVWREDVVDDGGVSRDTLLTLAPEQADGQVKVPKVL